jgi:proteasome lid subunit RPN8/RPN11
MTRSFIAPDATVAMDLTKPAFAAMLAAARRADRRETGGILIGRYGEHGDRVVVTVATTAPSDSMSFPAAFVRGVAGLTRRLRLAWNRGIYYVGEWHYHPFASPSPSGRDLAQIITFSREASYRCPHPILAIVGGNPHSDPQLTVHVVLDDGTLELLENPK